MFEQLKITKRTAVILASSFVALVIIISAYFLIFSVKVNIVVAPSDSTIKINERACNNNSSIRLAPGDYTLSVERPGFDSFSRVVHLGFGETYDFVAALGPNSTETADWYTEHSDDALVAERFGSLEDDRLNAEFLEKYSFTRYLDKISDSYRLSYEIVDDALVVIIDAVDGSYDEAFAELENSGEDFLDYEFRFPLLDNVFFNYKQELLSFSEQSSEALANRLTKFSLGSAHKLELLKSICEDDFCVYQIKHTYTVRDEDYINIYYVAAQKVSNAWKIVALPDLILTRVAYPDLPDSIFENISDLMKGAAVPNSP